MGRKIVVLADGTGNSAAKPFKTNVWRLYQALDLQGGEQLAAFADGVGTSAFRLFAVFGLALGFGVKSRVLTLYKFLCLNFREGDEIYAFGFSRGAFIVRVLVGMVQREGLVEFKSEEELERNATAAYRAYRRKAFTVGPVRFWVPLYRSIRDGITNLINYLTGSRRYDDARPAEGPRAAGEVKVRFLGVWDTVAAYGLPVEELTRAIDQMVWPLTFESCELLPCVQTARQAFAIDDERRTFFPIRWNENPADIEESGGLPPRLRQVWFAGSHSNVGGGYPDDRVSHLPLCWMIGEAARCGLTFKPNVVADYWDYASESGRVYDSRSGAGITYRYHPRSAEELMGGVKPLIDSSVIMRLKRGNDRYAPIAVPAKIEVLTPYGERRDLSFVRADSIRQSVEDYLPLPQGRERDLAAMQGRVLDVMSSVAPTDARQNARDVELLKDTVWWRRILYFVMLGLVLVLLAFPLLAGYFTRVRFNDIGNGIVGPIIGLLQGFLPGFARPWVEAIGDNSVAAVSIIALFGACLWLNNVLRTRIIDRARTVWNALERADGQLMAINRKVANRRGALAVALSCLIVAAIAAIYPDSSPAANISSMEPIGPPTDRFWIRDIAAAVGVVFLVLWMRLSYRQSETYGLIANGDIDGDIPATLRIARWVRTNRATVGLYRWAGSGVGPVLFLAAATLLLVAVVNKVVFQTAAAAGAFCAESDGNRPRAYQKLDQAIPFSTSDLCHDTGIRLDAGVTYRIKLQVTGTWLDDVELTDVRGFSPGDTALLEKPAYYLGNLFKRWWGEPYFKPIARINRNGNEEYALSQLQPERLDRGDSTTLFSLITPKTSGQLYLYVNDVAFALPGFADHFYRNNQGTAELTVERVALEAFD